MDRVKALFSVRLKDDDGRDLDIARGGADMDLSLLATLKEKLAEAGQFYDVLDYFLSNFGEKPEFIALGERIRHPFLEATIAQIGGQIFPGNVVVTNLLLTRVPGHD